MPRNVWHSRVDLKDVFRDESRTFEERRDEIVRRIRASWWFKGKDDGSWLHQIIEELGDTQSVPEFDGVWNAVYDEADADRCWIATS